MDEIALVLEVQTNEVKPGHVAENDRHPFAGHPVRGVHHDSHRTWGLQLAPHEAAVGVGQIQVAQGALLPGVMLDHVLGDTLDVGQAGVRPDRPALLTG